MADTPTNPTGQDAYKPAQIIARVEEAASEKAALPAATTFMLALLAGAFIAFGSMLYTVAMTDHGLGYGPARLLGGLVFSFGLILVIVAGAELFTGNNLIVMACADGQITLGALLRNWLIVFVGNVAGSLAMAVLMAMSGTLSLADGMVAETAIGIAEAKVALPAMESFIRGLLCNALVCLAVWLCFAARSVTDKILAIVFPVTAFVTLGFEHSIANAYLIPVGLLAGGVNIGFADATQSMVFVTLGNIVGGSLFVALVYWVIYGRRGISSR